MFVFEFTYNNFAIRLRILTILIWTVLAGAALFGEYPNTTLNFFAIIDLAIVISTESFFAITRLKDSQKILVLSILALAIVGVLLSYVLFGARFLWSLVLAIRFVTNLIVVRIKQLSSPGLQEAVRAAREYPVGDFGWLEAVLNEARKQVGWRAVSALYQVDQQTLERIVAHIIKKAPASAENGYLAAYVVATPILFATCINITTKPLTGSLDDWLSEVWEQLNTTGPKEIPIKTARVASSIPLSRMYLQDLPAEIDGALLEDEARKRNSRPASLNELRERMRTQVDWYGTAGPWTLYELGLAESERENNLGAANQILHSATILAEGLLSGSIKVLDPLSPLSGTNSQFEKMPAIGLPRMEDKLALMRVCAHCRLLLAESFNQFGLVEEAKLNIFDALEYLCNTLHIQVRTFEPFLEELLYYHISINALTGNWRGMELLLPPIDKRASAAEIIAAQATRAVSRLVVGDIDTVCEAVRTCCETLDGVEQLDESGWDMVYLASNAAILSGSFNEARYLLHRWQDSDKLNNWNNKERLVLSHRMLLVLNSLDESPNLVPHAAQLLIKMFEVTTEAARTLTQGELLSWLERSYLTVSSALTVMLDSRGEPLDKKLLESTILILASLRATSLNAMRYRRNIVYKVNNEDLTGVLRARGSLASDLASLRFQTGLNYAEDSGERLMMDRRAVFDLMLAQYFAQYEAEELRHVPSVSDVQATLSQDEVFVFCFRYAQIDPNAVKGAETEFYGAAIFRQVTPMQLVHLGSTGAIDYAIDRLIGSVNDGEALWHRQADALSDLLSPMLDLLRGSSNWVICPADRLSRAPFCLLRISDHRIADTVRIRYVSTLTELISSTPVDAESNLPLVLGNPDFDLYDPDDETMNIMLEYSSRESHEARRRGEKKPNTHFKQLSETESEAQEVASLLGVESHTGKEARESVIKSVSSPQILHLATHGYWIRSAADSNLEYPDALKSRFENSEHSHPFARSGIALAGANWFVDDRTIADQGNDGLLNGFDVLELDLTGTQLVVLSACRTGVTDSIGMAGALGLRFAFAVAGARAQLTTLWPVSDQVTRLFMGAFYDALVNKKESKSGALQSAQRVVRSDENFVHPFFWSAFVLYGDDTPIELHI